jgi:hypothetical protein
MRDGLRRLGGRSLAIWGAGAAALFALTWPLRITAPTWGLDPSWIAGLQMAWQNSMQFGRDVIFTYGPWGFTEHPALYETGAYRLAIAHALLVRAAEVLLVWVLVSRTWGRGWGWLVAGLVLCATPGVEPRTIVALAAAILILSDVTRRVPWWAAAGLGAWAGAELLGKQSTGVQIVLVLGAALALGPRPRRTPLVVFAGAAAAGLVLAWLAAGQDLGALPDFARGSFEIVAGYAGAMSIDDPDLRWAYWGALAVVGAAVAGLRASGESPRVALPGLVVVTVLTAFLTFKQAFVRFDAVHSLLFFAPMAALIALLPWGVRHRSRGLFALLLALICMFAASGIDPASVINLTRSPSDLTQAVRLSYDRPERERLIAEGRLNMLSAYGLQPPLGAALTGHSVHVVPWEIGVAWALRLKWSPLPVFQDYSAYTSYLDGKNTDRLTSDAGPERVLQAHNLAPDERYQSWDPPAQNVTLMCRYRPVAVQAEWRVLARSPDICGPVRRVAQVHLRWGQTIPIPPVAPNELLTARVSGLQPHGLETLRAILWKPAPRYAKLDATVIRVVSATAADGLLLRAPAAIDPPGHWRMAPDSARMTFFRNRPGSPQSGGDIEVTFEARTVAGA